MAYQITKNVPGGFPALTTSWPNIEVLEAQIGAAITSAKCVSTFSTVATGTLVLQFNVTPSAADLTAIDNVCNTHTGVGYVRGAQTLFSEGVQTEPGTTYVTKATLQSGLLAGGNYLVSFYSELAVVTADSTSGVSARILWAGVERAESSNNLTFYTSFSGSVILAANALDAPSLVLQLRRVGTANTAQVRRIRFAIAPIESPVT
jgi:hypothetical protein